MDKQFNANVMEGGAGGGEGIRILKIESIINGLLTSNFLWNVCFESREAPPLQKVIGKSEV